MRKSICQNPTQENRGKSGMPSAIKSKNHNSNTERVMMWQENVEGEDAFQRKDGSMINQTNGPVKNTWAKKSKES